jgi:hypothetical protein
MEYGRGNRTMAAAAVLFRREGALRYFSFFNVS